MFGGSPERDGLPSPNRRPCALRSAPCPASRSPISSRPRRWRRRRPRPPWRPRSRPVRRVSRAVVAGAARALVIVAGAARALVVVAGAARALVLVVAARALLARGARLHQDGGPLIESIDLDRQVTQHVVAQPFLPFQLGDRLRRCAHVQMKIVTLPVLLDPVGQAAQSPILGLGDLAAVLGRARRSRSRPRPGPAAAKGLVARSAYARNTAFGQHTPRRRRGRVRDALAGSSGAPNGRTPKVRSGAHYTRKAPSGKSA